MVSAIFVVLSSVILANHSRFGNLIVLQNLANDIALSIRKAQVYGIAVKRYGESNFDVGYGVHFNLLAQNTYVLFADANDNNFIDTGGAGEEVEASTIATGYRIVDLCARESAGVADTCSLETLDITFHRPEPDAVILRTASALPDQRAKIILESNKGDRATVVVEASGQISVQ